MKTLLVLRHAKSSWDDSRLDDHERPLNPRGRRDAPRMGALVADAGLTPDLIISSDAVRARQTSELVAGPAGYSGETCLDARLYGADPARIVAVLRTLGTSNTERVMIVAHNPGLEELVAQLTGAAEEMPTAALAHIVLPIAHWGDLAATTRGRLAALWRPKDLP